MFRRKKSEEEALSPEKSARLPQLIDDDPVWDVPGPRDYSEVDTTGYVDMGSLLLPPVPGMQIRTQLAQDQKTVVRIAAILGASGLQISVAAAPKSGGVWDEVRDQIRVALEKEGATVTDTTSAYGDELQVKIPTTTPSGATGTNHMRIIGREGPRWFVRIDMIGAAATDPGAAAQLEKVIDRMVIKRDDSPRMRLDLLPLHVPQGLTPVDD